MQTHRCKGSLINQCSIRNGNDGKRVTFRPIQEGIWTLYDVEYDTEYDWTGLRYVAPINYCPFCGRNLYGD